MPVLEVILADILIKTATSTAVNVISKRTIDPKIRLAAHAYRFYGLVDASLGIERAIRVAAFTDVAGIIASEIVVEVLSNTLTDLVPNLKGINFTLQKQAEGYLLSNGVED